jgi:cytochrome c biogenesis protein CcmG/thiol:disulfide interchange protein DsbE
MKKLIILLLVTTSLLLLVVSFFALNGGQTSVTSNDPMVGKTIGHINGATLEGQEADLQDYLHNASLINVWASWCSVCKQEHDYLLELAVAEGINIIGINYRDQKGAALETLQQTGNPYSVVFFDPEGTLAFELGVVGTPETFLVDAQGQIIKRYKGALNHEQFVTHFKSLLER